MRDLTYNDAIADVIEMAASIRQTAREMSDSATKTALYDVAAHVDDVASHLETKKRLHQEGRTNRG